MRIDNDECTSVWCSECGGTELDAYFEERRADDTQPISHFARDLGVTEYEHDWLERIESSAHGASTVGGLIRRTGGGDEMADALGPLTALPARCVVVLYHSQVSTFPTEHRGTPHPLRHLGNIRTPKALSR
jgi:hypothetical protein